MQNEKVAGMLRQIADILDYQGVAFKPAAYRRAAQTIEDFSGDILKLDKKQLLELPGVGQAIAEKTLEFGRTGRMTFLDNLNAETQTGAAGLMNIDDLGPKRVRILEQKLNIRTVAELVEAAEKGKISKLDGFSEILEKKILENAKRADDRVKRFPLAEIEADVEQALKAVRGIKGAIHVEAAGSYRRRKETVGDVDILIAVKKASEKISASIADAIRKLPIVERVIAEGATRIAFDLKSKLRVDIRVVPEASWGSALLYFTGSKEHNISLRRLAIERGWKLNEYGLTSGEKVLASKTEEEIYKKLGLPYIEPQNRVAELPK